MNFYVDYTWLFSAQSYLIKHKKKWQSNKCGSQECTIIRLLLRTRVHNRRPQGKLGRILRKTDSPWVVISYSVGLVFSCLLLPHLAPLNIQYYFYRTIYKPRFLINFLFRLKIPLLIANRTYKFSRQYNRFPYFILLSLNHL